VAVKTQARLQQEILCPAELPDPVDQVPPTTVTVAPGTRTTISSDSYVLTSALVRDHTVGGKFKYRMAIDAQGNTTLRASIRYDFIANDLRLALRDRSNEQVIARGTSSGITNRYTLKNFMNSISTITLGAGRYALDIEEDLTTKNLTVTTYCNFFGFDFSAAA
jgi:hypothetical protein